MRRKALVGILLVCLVLGMIPLSMSVSNAKESSSLPKSPFVTAEIKSIHYEKVYGTEMVKNGTEVSIKVVLTNISGEIGKSTLTFYSELEGAKGGIMEEVLKSGSSYTMDPQKVGEEVTVIWSGAAPEVGKQEAFTLLSITQETTEGKYLVIDIKKHVTSEVIEDVYAGNSEMTTHSNSKYGFEIQYPSDWSLQEAEDRCKFQARNQADEILAVFVDPDCEDLEEYDVILSNAYYKEYTLAYDFHSNMGKSIVKCWHNLDTGDWIVSEKYVHDGYGYEIAYFTKDETHVAIEHWRDVFNSFKFIEKETPGFEAVFAIIGLLIVAYLLRERRYN